MLSSFLTGLCWHAKLKPVSSALFASSVFLFPAPEKSLGVYNRSEDVSAKALAEPEVLPESRAIRKLRPMDMWGYNDLAQKGGLLTNGKRPLSISG